MDVAVAHDKVRLRKKEIGVITSVALVKLHQEWSCKGRLGLEPTFDKGICHHWGPRKNKSRQNVGSDQRYPLLHHVDHFHRPVKHLSCVKLHQFPCFLLFSFLFILLLLVFHIAKHSLVTAYLK